MSLTIHFDENRSAKVSDQLIETRPPDRIDFVAEGIITMTEELLGEFAGTTLKPARVDLSVDESHIVTIDLTGEASLRLEEVDVGVETPDEDGISPGIDALDSATDAGAGSPDITPGAIAFTVEGTVLDVSEKTFEPLVGSTPTLESITFAVDDAIKSDGGSNDVLLEFTLVGYVIVVRRDGTVEVGTSGGVTDAGPL